MRVMTWNLWWRRGPWRERYEAIRRVLRVHEPDVCGLQEIWADSHLNMAEDLAGKLGMYLAWAPSPAPRAWQERAGDFTIMVGNAVLSRWPILDKRQVRLPGGDAADDGRSALFALLDAPGHQIPFFTTHLSSSAGQSGVRCDQVKAVLMFVAACVDGSFPPIVTGDFNAEPDSDEVRLFEGRKTEPVRPDLVFVDSWRYAESQANGITWNRANPFVAEKWWYPSARIDYVFVGAPLSSGVGSVRSVRLIGDGPVDVWPSDHAGVLAEIVF